MNFVVLRFIVPATKQILSQTNQMFTYSSIELKAKAI